LEPGGFKGSQWRSAADLLVEEVEEVCGIRLVSQMNAGSGWRQRRRVCR
jgi:hypothetical protein